MLFRSELHGVRFEAIAGQFSERDIRGDQATLASGQALAAALQAAKELVGAQGEASAAAAVKSETSFTKQIDTIGALIQSVSAAIDARITELKERIDRGEGSTSGAQEVRTERREISTAAVAGIVGLFAILQVVVGLIVDLTK